MEVFDVVGFDNGYDYVKFVVGPGEENRELFPSVTYKNQASDLSIFNVGQVSKVSKYSKEKMIINYNGEEYFVGEYAFAQDATGGYKDYSDAKFKSSAEIAKFLAGIALFKNENKVKINNLILGLNVDRYKTHKDEIVDVFKNTTFNFGVSGSEEEHQIIVGNVICVPQGIGAYYDQILTIDGKASNDDLVNSRFALVDIGGKTVDAFIAQGRDPIVGTDVGFDYGISKAFQSVASKIGDGIPETLISQNYINGKKEVFWKNQYHQVEEMVSKAFSEVAEKIYTEVLDHWGQHINRVEVLILCGGGSRFIGDELADIFDIKTRVLEEPQFSNTAGYYKLGVYQNKKKERKNKAKKEENNQQQEDNQEEKKEEKHNH